MKQRQLKTFSYWILSGPSLIVYASIIIFPVLYSVILSTKVWNGYGPSVFIGIQHYVDIFQDPVFLHGLRNNIFIVAVSVFGQIPLGFLLAYIIYRKLVRAVNFFETMIFLPITISTVVIAILWNQIFSSAGIYTQLMRFITKDPWYVLKIFESKPLAIVPILFIILWMYTGMYMIMYLANLQKINPAVIEAAIIDGATEPQMFLHIILPSMLPILLTTAVFAISGSLKSFDLIYTMTGGGPAHYTEVIALFMYTNTFKYYKYGFGSAVSIIIILLSVGMISILQIITKYTEKKYS